MTIRERIKRGSTLETTALFERPGAGGALEPVDLTHVQIRSQIRHQRLRNELLAEVQITKFDQTTRKGQYGLFVATLGSWPLGVVHWDIRYSWDGRVMYTETIELEIEQAVTQ